MDLDPKLITMTTSNRLRNLLALVLSAVLTVAVLDTGPAQGLISTTQPQLTLNHLIRTSPFAGSSTTVRDNEGSAYVAADDALWIASDNDDALFEVDRTTGALRRKLAQSAFVNAPRQGVGTPAGQARTEDLEAIAYNANADVLYAFSGSTGSTPTVFRLTRGGNGQLQVGSWQPLPSEFTGAGWRPADGLTYVANGSTLRTYDFATNTLGPAFSISGLSNVLGVDFDDVTGDLLAVNSNERLYRASMTTRTILTGWNGISLTGFGLRDTRAIEVVGEQLVITDGDDSRADADPMNHAVFVIDVTGPGPVAPTASFAATPTTGTVSLAVTFTDTSSGGPTSWAWTFGDGDTSTVRSPTHTYTSAGTFTATLTATNAQGADSTTRTITVTEAPVGNFLDADTYVNTSSPTRNYGTYAWMKVHGVDSEYRPLVRFTLSGLSGPPTSVRLRLYVDDGSGSGGAWYQVSNDWSESTVVWNDAPTISGQPVATLGAITAGTWVEIDLTSAVTGNGTYSFTATSPSTNTAQFSSSQGTNVPQVLVVQ